MANTVLNPEAPDSIAYPNPIFSLKEFKSLRLTENEALVMGIAAIGLAQMRDQALANLRPQSSESATEAPKGLAKVRAALGKAAALIVKPIKAITRPLWDANYETKREKRATQEYKEQLGKRLEEALGGPAIASTLIVEVKTSYAKIWADRPGVWHDLVPTTNQPNSNDQFNQFQPWTEADTVRFQMYADQNTDTLVLSK